MFENAQLREKITKLEEKIYSMTHSNEEAKNEDDDLWPEEEMSPQNVPI